MKDSDQSVPGPDDPQPNFALVRLDGPCPHCKDTGKIWSEQYHGGMEEYGPERIAEPCLDCATGLEAYIRWSERGRAKSDFIDWLREMNAAGELDGESVDLVDAAYRKHWAASEQLT